MLTDILSLYIDSIESLVKILTKVLSKHFKRIKIGPFEFQLRRDSAEAYTTTFKKIEKAQANLSEAVDALDGLKDEYSAESKRLSTLLDDVKKKREEAEHASRELNFLQKITGEEREQLKRSLGLNDRRSKLIGFASGVLASVIATSLWVGVPKVWNAVSKWW